MTIESKSVTKVDFDSCGKINIEKRAGSRGDGPRLRIIANALIDERRVPMSITCRAWHIALRNRDLNLPQQAHDLFLCMLPSSCHIQLFLYGLSPLYWH